MKKKISLLLTICILLSMGNIGGAQASTNTDYSETPLPSEIHGESSYDGLSAQETIIYNYYHTVNQRGSSTPYGDWETRVNLTAPRERDERFAFSSNEINHELHIGIFNLESAELVYLEKTETAPIDIEYYSTNLIETYIVGLECTVFNEDLFTFNGINFDEVVLEYVDGEWYVLANRSVPIDVLSEITDPFLTKDAIAFTEANLASISTHNPLVERPELIDLLEEGDQEYFLDTAEMMVDECLQSNFYNGVSAASAPPMHSSSLNCQPSDIYVLIGGSVSIVTFDTYLKKTLQQEDGYEYSSVSGYVSGITESQFKEAKKANALAVKMFAWWCRAVYAKHKSEGAHLCNTTGCQSYSSSATPNAAVITAIDNIAQLGIRTSDNGLLLSQYLSGSWTTSDSSSTGVLKQRGSYVLAKQGKSYSSILSYYYANVPTSINPPYPAFPESISRGALSIFTQHSISPIWRHDTSKHWKICTACEYQDSSGMHYSSFSSPGVCLVCGRAGSFPYID